MPSRADSLVANMGCISAFRNDPELVAQTFAAHLRGALAGRFRRVVFSVLDTSRELNTFRAFDRAVN